jgi:4-hydroxybenzoate polyprenyltransferase
MESITDSLRHAVPDSAAAPADVSDRPSLLASVARALRPHQWAKNVLVALPALMAHRALEQEVAQSVALAFIALSLCASGTYVINDLLDREADRLHPTKRRRPFASGALTPATGVALSAGLILVSFGLAALTLPTAYLVTQAIYLFVTLAYSTRLRREPVLDVLVLAGLYALRVFAGAAATGIPVSEWLLAFSLFFFLDLALLKRYAELRLLETEIGARDNGRGYSVDDGSLLRGLGPATGLLAVLVLALYLTSPTVAALYRSPALLWFAAPLLLYWTSRIWLLAHRNRIPDDPVLFTVRDPASWIVGALTAAIVAAAALLP